MVAKKMADKAIKVIPRHTGRFCMRQISPNVATDGALNGRYTFIRVADLTVCRVQSQWPAAAIAALSRRPV